MFDLLKKKISNFIGGITKKEEQIVEAEPKEKPEDRLEIKKETEKPELKERIKEEPENKIEIKKETEKPELKQEVKKTEKPILIKEPEKKEVEAKEKEFKPSIGIKQKIAGLFTSTVTLERKNLQPVFDDFKTSLLESDVSFSTTDFMIDHLEKNLIDKKVEKSQVENRIKEEVQTTLKKIFEEGGHKNFFGEINKKPFTVLFVGPNGSGKTTTIAKIAFLAKKNNLTSVMVAADTFRKAAIEQIAEHGEKINIPVIKRNYGSDPTSVAFDAVSYAKAKGIDLVLIDTAGRQETNQNLIREMEKINRVIKPDLKIFIGESIAGNSLVEQVKKFNDAIKLDGVILTKIDFDVKGGVLLSIFHEVKIPVFFTANGQQYEDLKDFNPNEMIKLLISD